MKMYTTIQASTVLGTIELEVETEEVFTRKVKSDKHKIEQQI